MAILASWRLTEIIHREEIFAPIRKRLPKTPWFATLLGCPYCISWWAGLFAAAAFVVVPLANWPFALSSIYFLKTKLDVLLDTQLDIKNPKIVLRPGPNGATNVEFVNVQEAEAKKVIRNVAVSMELREEVKPNGM